MDKYLKNPATTIPGALALVIALAVGFGYVTPEHGTVLTAFVAGLGHLAAQQGGL
jgi:hypothetical protein